MEAVLDVGVDANDCVYNSIIQGFCMFCMKYFSLFVQTVFFALGWVFALAQLTSGGPSQCLNFGPSSEPGVNKGLGSL